jgi:hypothetical protein
MIIPMLTALPHRSPAATASVFFRIGFILEWQVGCWLWNSRKAAGKDWE